MIRVAFQGRLGNQLFQYAFAIATSTEMQVSFSMDQSQQRGIIYDYFELRRGTDSFLAKKSITIFGFRISFYHHIRRFIYRSFIFFRTNNKIIFSFENHSSLTPVENNSLIVGYFQSESFFIKHKMSILAQFKLKKHWYEKHSALFTNLYKSKKIVTLHIRKSDYQNLGHLNLGSDDLSLPFSYYHKVIAQLTTDDYLFIFTSDEPAKIGDEFSYLNNKLISYEDEITDFQHMMNADICIIANSTFSWWGAYLNNKAHKIVYCPKYFLGFQIKKTFPLDIYPKEWVQIDWHPE